MNTEKKEKDVVIEMGKVFDFEDHTNINTFPLYGSDTDVLGSALFDSHNTISNDAQRNLLSGMGKEAVKIYGKEGNPEKYSWKDVVKDLTLYQICYEWEVKKPTMKQRTKIIRDQLINIAKEYNIKLGKPTTPIDAKYSKLFSDISRIVMTLLHPEHGHNFVMAIGTGEYKVKSFRHSINATSKECYFRSTVTGKKAHNDLFKKAGKPTTNQRRKKDTVKPAETVETVETVKPVETTQVSTNNTDIPSIIKDIKEIYNKVDNAKLHGKEKKVKAILDKAITSLQNA